MDVAKTRTLTLECPEHGSYTGEAITFRLFGEKSIEVKPSCPMCQKKLAAKKEKQEKIALKDREQARWKAMNIEQRYWPSSFDTFHAYNDELRQYLSICRTFAQNPRGKLVMLGENGNGKTHLAVSILKVLGGVIYTAYEIGIKLRRSYGGDTKEWEVFEELCTTPLLVIDEVEKIKDSESNHHWLSHVVGKRYDRMLPLLFIANCHTQRDCRAEQKPCPRCLEYHLENNVLSRIIEDGIIMKFNNQDYRENLRASRMGRTEGR
jgi:DNA replication protein DnaC